MNYLTTYDLTVPGRNYESLYGALRSLGAWPVLLSVWALQQSGTDARGIFEALRWHIDSNDRLLVVQWDNGQWWGTAGNLLGQLPT